MRNILLHAVSPYRALRYQLVWQASTSRRIVLFLQTTQGITITSQRHYPTANYILKQRMRLCKLADSVPPRRYPRPSAGHP